MSLFLCCVDDDDRGNTATPKYTTYKIMTINWNIFPVLLVLVKWTQMDRAVNQKSNFIVLNKYSNTRCNMIIKLKRQRLFGISKITIESQNGRGEESIAFQRPTTRLAPKTN